MKIAALAVVATLAVANVAHQPALRTNCKSSRTMKIAALAVVATLAVANVAAADQPALRTASAPVEAAKSAGDNKKEQFWGGGPWGGMGWGGMGWGGGWGGCCGLGGWGGWGW
ncbi:hypothetical protein P3T76_003941 [Phytophthora citrophthora]|uniref:Uncharacterized protein n=1 Tax=Phytophthora citrophthora TaxID=4793 RepID=A0AAD9GSY6_9STRA|nr:hypothetical protein P3T76_003941 [Phytophthora citrophthora]